MLEERRFERLGGQKSMQVDFRLISATNRPLDQFVRDSRFREDLYYRVNAFSIRLPSLRERPVDIPVLANRFLARYCAAQRPAARRQDVVGAKRWTLLQTYHWPGNIRELESTVSRAALSAPGRVIRDSDIEFLHADVAMPVDGRVRRGCRRCATPSARISSACSTPCRGTRRKRHACSRSAAARSIERSWSTASNRRRERPATEHPSRTPCPELAQKIETSGTMRPSVQGR